MQDTETLTKKLKKHYKKADKLAIKIVEQLARKILRNDPELKEFTMAMGVYFFTDFNDEIVDVLERRMNTNYNYDYFPSKPSFKPLIDFIDEWDDVFKITGEAMRFTAYGEVITD